ncbi:hypothetical protein Strain138_002143 [Pseudogemmatithrix spongiicola]|uniref:Uncharacterized protein n=1 Tax=Pseudogemmatithrix spongiicola TaxID=3062599 RepID=A0AA49JVV6_9BACT|nr:hypothetical protein Strain138_002143 [Gemmatimonadaceae bacterium 'strain 138']WKW15740.1 hypothetical protein Strain318_002142 [Gemmatimonadaceae bacterium 'strain 318']
MTVLRWIAFAPLALALSLAAGGLTAFVSELFAGGPNWYTWLVSGAVTGGVCCYVAFRVAPTANSLVKWVTVGFVGLVGAVATIRPIFDGDVLRALQGIGMLVMAVTYARQSPASLLQNPEGVPERAESAAL